MRENLEAIRRYWQQQEEYRRMMLKDAEANFADLPEHDADMVGKRKEVEKYLSSLRASVREARMKKRQLRRII